MQNSAKTFPSHWIHLTIIALVSALELGFLFWHHHQTINISVIANQGIVTGTPLARAFQNRLLGPWLAWFFSLLVGSYALSFRIFFCLFWVIANVTMYVLAYRLSGSQGRALQASLSLIILTIPLMAPQGARLYLWDPLDIIFFSLFIYGIYNFKRWPFFLGVFLAELLNREAALFMTLWLILDAFTVSHTAGKVSLSLSKPKRLAFGGALLIGGVIWTKFIRDALFKHSYLAQYSNDLGHAALGNWWMLPHNVHSLGLALQQPSPSGLTAFAIYPLLALFFYFHIVKATPLTGKMLLLLFVMTLSVLCFALYIELRTWLVLTPLLIMISLAPQPRRSEG